MKKAILIVLSVLLALVLLAVIGIAVFGGVVIKKAVNVGGPAILGVPVTLQDAKFSPLRGQISLEGLRVGNPKGFKTQCLLVVSHVDAQVDMKSLLSDTIVLRNVLVKAPQITFERGLRNSNLGALTDQLGSAAKETDKSALPSTGGAKAKPGRKVVIDELTISGGQIRLSVTAAMGLSAPIALAEIRMKDIGRDGGTKGIGVTDVVRIVLGTVMKSALEAIGGVGGLALGGAKAVGGGAEKVGEATVEGVKSIGSDVGGFFGGHHRTSAAAATPQAQNRAEVNR